MDHSPGSWNVHREHSQIHQWSSKEGITGPPVRQPLFHNDMGGHYAPCRQDQGRGVQGIAMEPEFRDLGPRVGERRARGPEEGSRGARQRKRRSSQGREGQKGSPGGIGRRGGSQKSREKKARDKVVGIKSAEALFATTGLDPKEETRRRLRRKAKKLGKRSRNKKGSSGTSSSSGSSDSSPTEEAEAPEELFTPLTATQRIWRRYPGVLTATMVLEAQRTMMLQLGASLPEAEKAGVRPIILQYCRQQLCQNLKPGRHCAGRRQWTCCWKVGCHLHWM